MTSITGPGIGQLGALMPIVAQFVRIQYPSSYAYLRLAPFLGAVPAIGPFKLFSGTSLLRHWVSSAPASTGMTSVWTLLNLEPGAFN